MLTKKNVENATVIHSCCYTSVNTVYCLILNIAITVGNQQATMTNGSKYRKELLRVFYFNRINKKSIKNATVILSFCHTSENKIYCRFLHEAETLEKNASQIAVGIKMLQKTCSSIYFIRTDRKKYSKCERKTFILPH